MDHKQFNNLCAYCALAIVIGSASPYCKDCISKIPQDPPMPDYRPTITSISPTNTMFTASVSGVLGTASASPSPAASDNDL